MHDEETAPNEATARDGVTRYLPGTLILTFAQGIPSEEIEELVSALGCSLQEGFENPVGYAVIVVPEGRDEELLESFSGMPQVTNAALNTVTTIQSS